MDEIRVGIVGLGANTRLRHVPGLQAVAGVQIVGVCNRSQESTQAAAAEFNIPRTYTDWRALVEDPDVDAVVIGTWPYLHCEITLAALRAGKHVLTEARMACNASEAHQMLDASREHSQLVTQIVPSPFGMAGGALVKELMADGYLGSLREIVLLGLGDAVADPSTPLHWRQSAEYSGLNMLLLGILHETLTRWTPDPTRVLAQTHVFTPQRAGANPGELLEVGTPDSVQVLTELPNGARGVYHLSGGVHFGAKTQIHLYGSKGTLKYVLAPQDRLYGAVQGDEQLSEIAIPREKQEHWRVEQEFIEAIRGQGKVRLNDFPTGVRYMEFTEAVARSAQTGQAVSLPLID